MDGAEIGARAATLLRELDCCAIGPGLTDAEFDDVEGRFGFTFADDHRAFLAEGLPLRAREMGWDFPDWRNLESSTDQLAWPVDGIVYDVENGFWDAGWGERPADVGEATYQARRLLRKATRMVPVYGHRYLPAGRGTWGHPVLSMHQTDIIYYGMDLADYIDHEFSGAPQVPRDDPRWQPRATVPVWSRLVT